MRPLPILKAALIFSGGCLLFACQKETITPSDSTIQSTFTNKEGKTYQLQGKFDFYYTFKPDLAAGYIPPNSAPGLVAGGAAGEMNYMGKCESYYVHYNYLVSSNPYVAKARAVSMNGYYADTLEKRGVGFTVPDTASTVMFDKQGNAIFLRLDQNGMTYKQVNDTLTTLTAKYDIVGGAGKFANAKGWLYLEGHFDPRLPLLPNYTLGYQFNAGYIIKDGMLKF